MRYMRRIFSMLLLLLVLLTAASAAGFSFRGGVTWDTTPAQMLAAEGRGEGGGNYNREEYNGYLFYYLWNRNGANEDIYYVFRGEQPVMAYELIPAGTAAARQQAMGARYGAPVDVSAQDVSALMNTLLPNSVTPADFSALAAWRLDDGTLAVMITVGSESYEMYFHPQRIQNGA